jgi:acid stress-induced BolA-like protein IbaG/YrbA
MHPEHIKQLILAGMACDYLELDGDGQHFQAIIVSSEFVGKNRVQRQQRVSNPAGKTGDRGVARPFLQNPDPGRMERPAWISC